MTEYDLYVSCIPQIAEIVTRCRKLSRSEYEDWKQETMEQVLDSILNRAATAQSLRIKIFI